LFIADSSRSKRRQPELNAASAVGASVGVEVQSQTLTV
jgi:hypothetical protein